MKPARERHCLQGAVVQQAGGGPRGLPGGSAHKRQSLQGAGHPRAVLRGPNVQENGQKDNEGVFKGRDEIVGAPGPARERQCLQGAVVRWPRGPPSCLVNCNICLFTKVSSLMSSRKFFKNFFSLRDQVLNFSGRFGVVVRAAEQG